MTAEKEATFYELKSADGQRANRPSWVCPRAVSQKANIGREEKVYCVNWGNKSLSNERNIKRRKGFGIVFFFSGESDTGF